MSEVTTVTLPVSKVLPIEDVQPYWRNPRRIPAEAVEALRQSIERYGYVQPIVVDPENVVIVGHTRLAALKEMGATEVPVYVSDLPEAKVKEYRLVDNRTGEMTAWDHTALVMELREWETSLLSDYFPDLDLEIDAIDAATHEITAGDVEKATREAMAVKDPGEMLVTHVECPACEKTFDVRTDSLPGLSRDDLEALAGDGRAE